MFALVCILSLDAMIRRRHVCLASSEAKLAVSRDGFGHGRCLSRRGMDALSSDAGRLLDLGQRSGILARWAGTLHQAKVQALAVDPVMCK